MAAANLLGEYLRARRARVTPADAGLPPGARRRVPGLRREEVALLAGISTDYYLRLEQGRDRNPSRQVLESLARVLRLDRTAHDYLLAVGAGQHGNQRRRLPTVAVPASIERLVDAVELPAFVQDKHFDVLSSNRAARALSPTLAPGINRLLAVLTDPIERALFRDWDDIAAELVASFRASVAGDAGDPRTAELVTALSAHSEVFAKLWARHDVENRVDRPPVRFRHPVVGELTLTRDHLAIDSLNDLRLVVYHAARGTTSAEQLARLRASSSQQTSGLPYPGA